MIDIEKQISYWSEGGKEDMAVGKELLDSGRTRHGLFLVHLALEKMLKAHVCRATNDLPPRTHNLVRLAQLSGTNIKQDQLDVLAEMNAFNVEGRYPEPSLSPPTPTEAREYLTRAEEIFRWLTNLL